MKELGMALLGTFAISLFFGFKIYPDLEYSGYGNGAHSCTGECYAEYVRVNGTPAEIEQRKQAAAATDEFSSIRSLWAGCAACHGADGGGGIGPMLAGQSSDDIVNKLTIYKNNGQIGAQSALMWGQAAMLSEQDIKTIGDFIQAGLPSK
jgi:cytochrome c553